MLGAVGAGVFSPLKGYHFDDSPYVEYRGALPQGLEKDAFVEKVRDGRGNDTRSGVRASKDITGVLWAGRRSRNGKERPLRLSNLCRMATSYVGRPMFVDEEERNSALSVAASCCVRCSGPDLRPLSTNARALFVGDRQPCRQACANAKCKQKHACARVAAVAHAEHERRTGIVLRVVPRSERVKFRNAAENTPRHVLLGRNRAEESRLLSMKSNKADPRCQKVGPAKFDAARVPARLGTAGHTKMGS